MTKQLACVALIAALGAACTQQSPQGPQPPAAGQDAAVAPGAAAPPSGSMAASARPGGSSAAPAASAVGTPPAPPKPTLREVTIPSGTSISVTLDTSVASDTSRVEDVVRGKLSKPIVVEGMTVVPSGSEIAGTVTEAKGSGKVQGRASIAFKFDTLTARNERIDIRTSRFAREAAPTKGKDATKVGIGAGAGALIGAIAGGGKGAAIGGAVGAGAGTGVVLATKGEEVRLGQGALVTVRLQEPVKVLVPID
jgi:hypothetical protein